MKKWLILVGICKDCGECEGECPVGALTRKNGITLIDKDKCIDCGCCVVACPEGAIDLD